jgi:hypothetical protein
MTDLKDEKNKADSNWAEKLKKSIDRNPIIVSVTIIIFIASQVTTLTQGIISLWSYYSKTIDWRKMEENKINSLSVSMSLENFIEILGKPLFRRKKTNHIEYIFRRDGYWTQAITRKEDEGLYSPVIMYSITSCQESFRPDIKIPPTGEMIKLRETTFKAASKNLGSPTNLDYRIGGATANQFIFEEFYLANPGRYQTIFFGYNDACPNKWDKDVGPIQLFDARLKREIGRSINPKNKLIDNFRSKNSFNTFAITSPSVSTEKLAKDFQIGVDRIEIRVFSDVGQKRK